MSWLVTSYYTENTIYDDIAKNLAQSLLTFNIPYEIVPTRDLGSWDLNTHYKPLFLKEMLKKYYPKSIIWVDCDAVFMRYPALFNDLDKDSTVNVAACILDHNKYRRKGRAPELLSGTLYFKNENQVSIIIDRWIQECQKDPHVWDQVALSRALDGYDFYKLPDRYCCIHDYMASVDNKVIIHYQASRVARNKGLKL
jgi:hypothetical protein